MVCVFYEMNEKNIKIGEIHIYFFNSVIFRNRSTENQQKFGLRTIRTIISPVK